MRGITVLWLLIVALIPGPLLAAEENKEEDEEPKKVQYINIKPPIVVNFGNFSRKGKFLQVKVSLRVENENDAIDVSYHQAPIRHNLIMLFSSLPSNGVSNPQEIEALRKQALKVTQDTLLERAKDVEVTDLLFTSFVKQ